MPASPTARIAVVDDEESVRRGLERLLRAAGYQASEFASGREFLDALSTTRPACVVLDLNMPRMDGFEVYAQLRQLGHDAPVVAITGHDTDDARKRSEAAGVFAYLCKPIDASVLLKTIDDAISVSTPKST